MKRRQNWFEQLRDFILGRDAGLTNFNEGARNESLLQAVAQGLEEESFTADSQYRQLYYPSASGEGLRARAAEIGLKFKPALKATGFFRFVGTAGTVIDEGTKVATGDPTVDEDVVEYATTEAGEIPLSGTTVDVPIEAVVAGASGTAEAGAVDTVVDTVPGITGGSNPSRLSGYDEESDEELRRRCALAPYRMAAGGPPKCWEALALDVVGVARVRIQSCWAGSNTFKVLCWSRDAEGTLVPAAEDVLEAVDVLLQTYVIPGVALTVAAPDGPMLDVVGYLEVGDGYTWETVAGQVAEAIEALFPTDEVIIAAVIAAAMGVTGAKDFRLAAPAENQSAGEGFSFAAGTVRILPLEWDGMYTL